MMHDWEKIESGAGDEDDGGEGRDEGVNKEERKEGRTKGEGEGREQISDEDDCQRGRGGK